MKRLLVVLLLLPLIAVADQCFDYDSWRQALVTGNFEQAGAIVMRARQSCGCETEAERCINLPGQATPASPRLLNDTTLRIQRWTEQLAVLCGSLPETSEREQQAKVECYRKQAEAFSLGLLGEQYGNLWRTIPPEIADRYTKQWGESIESTPVNSDERLEGRYSQEAIIVGRQICRITEKLHESEQLLQQVRRRGNYRPADKRKRELELTEAIKAMREQLTHLKRKFRSITSKNFDPFIFCGSIDE